ncbi:putative nuclear segregation protein (Bfr1) [Aspergillus undulatus]|uniref:putative nuclear segregation protein (Bfr1) n=1 Tax=Aspergillus undulatus TaxID=1810928 RepID=UPI003CCDCBBB
MAAAVKSEVASEPKVKPTRPDEDAFKASLAQAEKEHAAVQEKLNQVKAKIETAKPNNQDSPAAKRQQELRAELSSIRQKQQGFKATRTSTQEKINAIDATLKARIAEQNNSRTRMSFKNVDELDREISRLEKQVDSGTLRLVDEKKILADISSLRKQRKNFASLDDAQKVINDLKTQIATLKKTLDNPEQKALSDKYTEIQKELDGIKAEQDSAFKNLNALRDERTKLHGEQQTKWAAIREVKDNYYKARKAYKEYEDEAWRIRREKQKAQREAFEREKKRKVADKKLEEASRPAYTDDILVAQGLIRHFNPSYDFAALGLSDKKEEGPGFRAEVGRTVEDSGIKGMKVLKKDEDDYFVGTGGKKGKKGKKGGANGSPAPSTPAEAKFNMNVGIIEDFAKIKIDPPMNQSDVPAVVEKLAAKITEWKKDQASKTEENINKAKEEIARLDAEDSAATETNGKTEKETAEVTEDLQKATLEEKA